MKALTIKAIELDFPNQWLLIEVTATKDGTPIKGVVRKAGADRQKVIEAIGRHKDKKLYFLFSGILASPNSAFAVSCFRAHCNQAPEQLLIDSDYRHNDPAEEKALVLTMRSRSDLPAGLAEKTMCENPQRFYGLNRSE